MNKSTMVLPQLLQELTGRARQAGLNDAQWARAAALRKESLSRLRGRASCDFATLQALAAAVNARIEIAARDHRPVSEDGHFPAAVERDYEQRLLALASSSQRDPAAWAAAGPRFFMAGLATMAASVRGCDRRRLLELADRLHAGMCEPQLFQRWLDRSPVRPSRFLPLLKAKMRANAA
jgi:hypothetical protein